MNLTVQHVNQFFKSNLLWAVEYNKYREECVNFYVEYSTCFNMFPVRCVNQMCEIFKEQLNALPFTNVILLHINRRHVSATLVVIFSVMGTNIQGVS